MGRPPKNPVTEPDKFRVTIYTTSRDFTETIKEDVKLQDLVRELESCKKSNTFWVINGNYYNTNQIIKLAFFNQPFVNTAPVTPPMKELEKTLEQLQREKQPDLDRFKNVYNGE